MNPPPPSSSEKPSVILASLFFLGLDVVAYGALVVHTLLSRRRYGKFVDEHAFHDLSFAQDFFLTTPAPLYAAGFLLLVTALIVKECAIERKGVTLRLNLLALALACGMVLAFLWTVQWRFERFMRP
jgi:hypothetical protein